MTLRFDIIVGEKSVLGVAKVVREHYPDPTKEDERSLVVDFEPEIKKKPVSLEEIKSEIVLTKKCR